MFDLFVALVVLIIGYKVLKPLKEKHDKELLENQLAEKRQKRADDMKAFNDKMEAKRAKLQETLDCVEKTKEQYEYLVDHYNNIIMVNVDREEVRDKASVVAKKQRIEAAMAECPYDLEFEVKHSNSEAKINDFLLWVETQGRKPHMLFRLAHKTDEMREYMPDVFSHPALSKARGHHDAFFRKNGL